MSDEFGYDPVPTLLGQVIFHPNNSRIGLLLGTISQVRQALEFLELRYADLIRRQQTELEQEGEQQRPAPRKAARKQQTTGQGRGRPRKQAATNGAAPPAADPPLFPPPEPAAEHAA